MGELPPEVAALRSRLAELDERMADPDHATRAERQAAVAEAAHAARFHNPELAARLLADAEGEPDAIVADLAASEPYLVRPTMDDLIRHAARRDR